MSAEEKPAQPVANAPEKKREPKAPPSKIFLVSYPKIVFFYPTLIVSLIAAIYMSFVSKLDPASDKVAVVFAVCFLGVMATNMVIIAFDFPRATSLTLFFLVVAVILGLVLLFVLKPHALPFLTGLLGKFRPLANAPFYWGFSIMVTLILIAAVVVARFDYWEARPNELLHRRGLWGDLDRYPAPGLRIEKEVSDVFEYLLLGSGRLILHISNERRAAVLENVPFIHTKEHELTHMLGILKVDIQTAAEAADTES